MKAGWSLILLFTAWCSVAAVYEVGPGKSLTSLTGVPWETLQAGDTVLIHYQAVPYAAKWVLCRQGTAVAPITVKGVPGPTGELPVIDGNAAKTRTNLNYWGENRSLIKIGGASKPADTMPRHIVIENLEVRSARPPYTYTSASGAAQNYVNNAASIWIEKGQNITIRNCTIQDSGNGLFVSSSDTALSSNIVVEGCYIYGNGNTNSLYEHNVYTAAAGITYQFNRFGPLRAGCLGNNLKDRSAGLVVRYNWIEGGNRELDLVDAEDSAVLRNDPRYRETFVYGNVIIEPPADGNKQLIHYGGDSGTTTNYRKGTLYFYHNTVVSKRSDQTTLFRFSTNDEYADARNNILLVTNNGNSLALVDSAGRLALTRNWLKTGWVNSFSALSGSITINANLSGSSPGFVNLAADDYHLVTNSLARNSGTNLHPATLPLHPVQYQYVRHQTSEPRLTDGSYDLGAYEVQYGFAAWAADQFGTNANISNISSETADPDGDGIVNLREFAFGLDPSVASQEGLPRAQVLTDPAPALAISFTRRPPPCGLTYIVQTSSNLIDWVDGCRYSDTNEVLSAGGSVDVTPPGATSRTVRFTEPIESSAAKFLRILVLPSGPEN